MGSKARKIGWAATAGKIEWRDKDQRARRNAKLAAMNSKELLVETKGANTLLSQQQGATSQADDGPAPHEGVPDDPFIDSGRPLTAEEIRARRDAQAARLSGRYEFSPKSPSPSNYSSVERRSVVSEFMTDAMPVLLGILLCSIVLGFIVVVAGGGWTAFFVVVAIGVLLVSWITFGIWREHQNSSSGA